MDIVSELNQRSKKGPKQFRYIALYYLIIFWLSIVFSVIAFIGYIIIVPDDKLTILNSVKIASSLIIACLVNFFILKITLNFILGSLKSYWILLIICLIQCFAFKIGNTGFEFVFGGIPTTFSIIIGTTTFNINLITILFSVYLISIRKDYKKYLLLSEDDRLKIRYV
jgi:hypothetical protein